MKVRLGFVSNSSSSSFCLAGVRFDDLDELLEAATAGFKKRLVESGLPVREDYADDDEHYEALCDSDPCAIVRSTTGLHALGFLEEQPIYIGRDFTTIGDDETPRRFKADVKDALLKWFKASKLPTVHIIQEEYSY